MKKLLAILLFVFAAHPLFANCGVQRSSITPARPTTTDHIEVVLAGGCGDGCIPHSPRVTVGNGTITIDLEQYDGCILTPQPWGERVDVGRVPAGTYALIVKIEGAEALRQQLVVRQEPFAVRPSFGEPGTEVVLETRDPELCANFPCVFPEVRFGGVQATVVRMINDGDFVVIVPPHAPGIVDVTVRRAGSSQAITNPQAFLYPAPQADLTAEYERILFPISFQGPGAHGSLWTTDSVVVNNQQASVAAFPGRPIPSRGRVAMPNAARDGGIFLFVPRGAESWLAYSSHIVDRSRRATDAGTELRVVRLDDAGPRLQIVNVPFTNESRQTLRVYDLDAVDGREVLITVIPASGASAVGFGARLQHRIVCVTTPCYPEHPTFAVVNLDAMSQLRGIGAADILVHARTNDAPLWAFVSVTNNDTQHVTTFSPQHRPYDTLRLP